MKLQAWITVGASACGKSTWALEHRKQLKGQYGDDYRRTVIVNRDRIRGNILDENPLVPYDESVNLWTQWKSTKSNEAEVSKRINKQIHRCIRDKANMIISDTNLNDVRRDTLIKMLESNGYTVIIQLFDIQYQELVKRDAKRLDTVGAIVIGRQLDQLHKSKIWKEYIERTKDESVCKQPKFNTDLYGENLPPLGRAVLVDLDGTLAHMTTRKPYDWDKVGEDDFDEIVWSAVIGVANKRNADIIFVSGRNEVCKSETLLWLKYHISRRVLSHACNGLYMREKDDMRDDTIVKCEMVNDISKTYDIIAVFDDRPKVARMYRSLGLKVFQLGNPHLEF